jgi:hypothetical protein
MKIRTQISMTIEKADGTVVVLERATTTTHGDNPRFERVEAADALVGAHAEFVEKNTIEGTRSF